MLGTIAKKIVGTANDRKLKALGESIYAINAMEPDVKALSDDELRGQTALFRSRLEQGAPLDTILVEAFATVREASRRTLGMRPFDVQLLGGIALHRGKIAEMKTGEGKTLVATMPIYLNALAGKGVHLVTVNDYLAKRDAEWMGRIYNFLQMSVGTVLPNMEESERRQAYDADITYATNNELGFDYLRDNMKFTRESMLQRRRYAIIDEVDSILVDEARTPLIISGPAEDHSDLYKTVDAIMPSLTHEHFELDEKARSVTLTEEGNEFVEQALQQEGILAKDASFYDPQSVALVHHVNQALRAHILFQRDRDYIVRNGRVVIIDEFTGRMMEGRRYGDGQHQAIEAKENQAIQPENTTLASITFQNYFRLYDKLAGMTGTAATEADEFMEIYKLDVVSIPTNLDICRQDEDDRVYRTAEEKMTAITEAITDGRKRGQPILVGTTSIEKSETLSARLKQLDIPHSVLNARFHEQEAQIIAEAGVPGAVTIATNMAGRGTDIQLGGNVDMRFAQRVEGEESTEQVAQLRKQAEAEVESAKSKALEAGGLWVIGTERHESRRIDNQLRGRSGRQGDPGRSTFFLSLEDDLMRIFGSERMDSMLRRLGIEEGEAIVHSWINKAIERSQKKVEALHFERRKNLLKYDDVMNDQRKAIFAQRLEIMEAENLIEIIQDMRHALVDDMLAQHIASGSYAEDWDIDGLQQSIHHYFNANLPVEQWSEEEGVDIEVIRERLYQESDRLAAQKTSELGTEIMRDAERYVVLDAIDKRWREHLSMLDHLRSVVGLRGYAQRDPLNEFKSEAFTLFENLLARLRGDVTAQLMHVQIRPQSSPPPQLPEMHAFHPAAEDESTAAQNTDQQAPPQVRAEPERSQKIGRNAPCPCGSGKKYKHCHGRAV